MLCLAFGLTAVAAGWSDSLNVSVATACVATRLFWLDPSLRGAMGESERGALRKEWYQRCVLRPWPMG